MNTETNVTSPWLTAQQKCWSHVETATNMTKLLDALKAIDIAAVITILSDSRPTLMLTPTKPADLMCIKATVRLITENLTEVALVNSLVEWQKIPIGGEWLLRCNTLSGITVDVMTRLPATKESPIEV